MTSIIFLLFAFSAYLLVYVRSRDLLHPLGIGILLWFLAAALSNAKVLFDQSIQVELSLNTNIAIFLSGIFFTIPFVYSKKINKDIFLYQAYYFGSNYKYLFNFFALLSFIAFIVRFQNVLASPTLVYGATADLKDSVPSAVPIINFADLSTTFLAILCVFELKYSAYLPRMRKFNLMFYILFCIVTTLVYKVSRGEFLVFVLGCIYLFLLPRKLNIKIKPLILIFTLSFLFFYLGDLRMSGESRVNNHFGDGGGNVILSQMYTYIAMNFQNLNTLINSNFEPTYIWGSFKFFLKPFFNDIYLGDELTDYSTLFFNAKTFIYYFYNDLGMIGVIIYPFLIGFFLQSIYNKSINNIKYFVVIACFMKSIVFLFFGNYFFGELVVMTSYMIIFILLRMPKLKIKPVVS